MDEHDTFFGHAEAYVYHVAEYIKLGIEILAVAIVTWGIIYSLGRYGGQLFGINKESYVPLRLSLSRYLIVALEFQLAADILGTAIAPSWEAIGKLAAIAVIRTLLNYFLGKEVEKEVKELRTQEEREEFKEEMT